jgi:membrane-associated protein
MISTLLDVLLHLDRHLAEWSASLGPGLYGLLFVVVFCETGLVVTPFLPGDSLLFAVGAVCALPGAGINVFVVSLVLIVAAITGDALNYKLGQVFGAQAFSGRYRLINKRHLEKTRDFYDRNGGKAIVLARFAPILRTFAPFVAGVGQMPFRRFLAFNVSGGVAWVTLMCAAGYSFGNNDWIRKHFELVLVAIVVISFIPAVLEAVRGSSQNDSTPA